MNNKPNFISLFLLAFLFIPACVIIEFEFRSFIEIEGFSRNDIHYVRDTVDINYSVQKADIDSVCLYIQDSLHQTQIFLENTFHVVFDSTGNFEFYLLAFLSDGNIESTDTLNIEIYSRINPKFYFICSRIDGDKYYFVGEQLGIHIKPKIDGYDMSKFKEATMFLNGNSLGSQTEQPFYFETDVITESENSITLEIIDTANHVYIINEVLDVPVNTPPEIEYGFKYRYGIKPGYYYSIDPVIFTTGGNDNVEVDYIDYYIDNELVNTCPVNSKFINVEELKVDTLGIGNHTSYCIVYDDRGDSTISNLLNFVIYKTYSFTDGFSELALYTEEDITYAITGSKLYSFDNKSESQVGEYKLPHLFPKGLSVGEECIYIGFKNGTIVSFDEETKAFQTVIAQTIFNLTDFEIDTEQNVALTISNSKIKVINLETKEIYESEILLDDGSTIAVDKENKRIIAGGNPGESVSDLYKFLYSSNSLNYLEERHMGGYAKKIILDPDNARFMLLPNDRIYNQGYGTYSISDFSLIGRFERNNLNDGCFGNKNSRFYAGDDFNDVICAFDTKNFSLATEYSVPNDTYADFKKFSSSADNSKLIVSTFDSYESKTFLFFVRH